MDSAEQCRLAPAVFQDVLHFEPEWCVNFFDLSGDQNHKLHSPSFAGIVQGMAILTKLGTVISKRIPGYMVAKMSNISFRQQVHIGNNVVMETNAPGIGKRIVRADVRLLIDETVIAQIEITLVRG